jgi:hypothetical protein
MRLGLPFLIAVALASACASRLDQGSTPSTHPALRGAPAVDSASDEEVIYSLVLEHALSRYPARRGVPVVLDSTTSNVGYAPHCVDSTRIERMHSRKLVEHLRAKRLIHVACVPPPRTAWGCSAYPDHDYIWASIPFRLSEKFRIGATEGVEVIQEIPPGTMVGADIALDVVMYGGCPRDPECRSQNVVMFRYFLARGSDRAYRIIARIQTGAV